MYSRFTENGNDGCHVNSIILYQLGELFLRILCLVEHIQKGINIFFFKGRKLWVWGCERSGTA
jgi:hypothetical protein